MKRVLPILPSLFLAAVALADDVQRDKYQRIVEMNYPGFRILSVADFVTDVHGAIHDGTSGSLIVGNFNYDEYPDFAALVVGSEKKRYKGNDNYSYDYFDGKEIICHGRKDVTLFECKTNSEMSLPSPQWWYIERIAPATYSCLVGEDEGGGVWRTITTEADSVGSVFPEKGEGFSGTYRDGTKYDCTSSD